MAKTNPFMIPSNQTGAAPQPYAQTYPGGVAAPQPSPYQQPQQPQQPQPQQQPQQQPYPPPQQPPYGQQTTMSMYSQQQTPPYGQQQAQPPYVQQPPPGQTPAPYGAPGMNQTITYTHTQEKSRSCWGWGPKTDAESDMAYADLMAAMDDVLTKYQNQQLPPPAAAQQSDQIMSRINAIGQVDGARATEFCQQRGITDAKRKWMDETFRQLHQAVAAGGGPCPPQYPAPQYPGQAGGPRPPLPPPTSSANATHPKGRKWGCC
mmetsp:Transcript_15236/g.34769  ORF Transcript_15236/g.34769 Transcript_15236/m.34769 type:complete len:262 (+) Transcript_15236:53-838(+)